MPAWPANTFDPANLRIVHGAPGDIMRDAERRKAARLAEEAAATKDVALTAKNLKTLHHDTRPPRRPSETESTDSLASKELRALEEEFKEIAARPIKTFDPEKVVFVHGSLEDIIREADQRKALWLAEKLPRRRMRD